MLKLASLKTLWTGGDVFAQLRKVHLKCLSSSSNQKCSQLEDRLKSFMEKEVLPAEKEVMDHMFSADRWTVAPIIEKLKDKARDQGLWNMWIPLEIDHKAQLGHGLTNEQYARLAEIMGAVPFASECFNCSAPDTGNMEVLIKYGNEEQKEEWLKPLLEGAHAPPLYPGAAHAHPAPCRADPLRLCHDGAGRRKLRRHQHPGHHGARRGQRRLRARRAQVVHQRRHGPPLPHVHLHGPVPPPSRSRSAPPPSLRRLHPRIRQSPAPPGAVGRGALDAGAADRARMRARAQDEHGPGDAGAPAAVHDHRAAAAPGALWGGGGVGGDVLDSGDVRRAATADA